LEKQVLTLTADKARQELESKRVLSRTEEEFKVAMERKEEEFNRKLRQMEEILAAQNMSVVSQSNVAV
jgi:hypothetical protein